MKSRDFVQKSSSTVQTTTKAKLILSDLSYLPAYAAYLLGHKLDEYVHEQIRLSRELELPLLKKLEHFSEKELFELTKQSTREFLQYLADNRPEEQIRESIRKWVSNQLPVIQRDAVIARDISLITYIRKRTLTRFLSDFTSEPEQMLEVIQEIDFYLMESEAAITNTYITLLQEAINEHAHFIEQINRTSPNFIYVEDLATGARIYSNGREQELLGYTKEEAESAGLNGLRSLIHPDDLLHEKNNRESLAHAVGGTIVFSRFRVRTKNGTMKWLRSYESPFKILPDGTVTQIIGIAIDISKEKKIAEELHQREQLFLDAQEMANLGNYVWNFDSKKSSGSPQIYKILESTPEDVHAFKRLVHPDDREKVDTAIHKAIESGIYECEFRIITTGGIKFLWSKGKVLYKDGRPSLMEGMLMDVTHRNNLLEQLRENENLYKQAEALTHIGNYVWNVKTNELKWSDEMFRIYGIDANEFELTFDRVAALREPEENDRISEAFEKGLQGKKPFDFYYRIRRKNGDMRIVHARCNVQLDNQGEVENVLGTVQDVTERQNLIEELRRTESLYKQAEELANMGNWSWDLKTSRLEWTDQLYRIYGMEPKSEPITIERFLGFIHPDDYEMVEKELKATGSTEYLDNTFRIITADGKLKTIRSVSHVHYDDAGKPSYVIGTERDITEKQSLIERLQQSQELYKQAQSIAHMGNWSWDINANKVEWSDELYRIFGVEQGTPIDFDTYTSLLHPDDREAVVQTISSSLQTLRPYEFYHRIKLKDGKILTLHSRGEVLLDQQGKASKIVGTAQDVTERQNLIDELKRSEARFLQAQSLAKMGNFSWDLETNLVEWSDEVYHIHGLEPGNPVGFNDVFGLIVPEYQAEVQEAITETVRLKKGRSVSYAIQLANGAVKHLNLETDVALDEMGNVSKIIGTAQDITERQNLIERLQESEELYKQAQSLARLGNWSYNLLDGTAHWSDELYDIYELPKDAVITRELIAEFMHPDDREQVLAYLQECIDKGKSYDLHHRIVLKSGKVKTIYRKAEPVLDDEGRTIKLVGTTQDVTEQHRIQQELRDNQTFIKKIADATPSIIASYNVNTGHYSFVSEGLYKLLGYEASEAMEKGIAFFMPLIHPDDMPVLMEKNNAILQEANQNPDSNELIAEFNYRMRHKHGHYRWFHTYGTVFDRNSNGMVENVLNISLDITDQVEAAKKIEEQQHFIQHIADASPTILYLFDAAKGCIAYMNREVYYVLGYTPEEITASGDAITDLLYHPEDISLLPERKISDKHFQHRNSMMQYECRMKTKDGEYKWMLVREVIFKTDASGNIIQILGAALDISRRKDMEKTLLQNSFQLEQSNASLEEFAYVASHDLKEPLRKISTFGDRLVHTQMDSLNRDGKTYLTKIVEAAKRMQNMIDDLLAVSMISGNHSYEKFSLQSILRDVLQTLEFKIEQSGAVIEADKLPDAYIVPSQFRQLFQNLVSNSLKFMREGVQPRITITHEFVRQDEVASFQLPDAKKYLKLRFTDNGIGFENEYASKIFAIFQRLHGRSEYEGTGIGLAICKKIVEHHRGVIFATGQAGEGATFTIILPS